MAPIAAGGMTPTGVIVAVAIAVTGLVTKAALDSSRRSRVATRLQQGERRMGSSTIPRSALIAFPAAVVVVVLFAWPKMSVIAVPVVIIAVVALDRYRKSKVRTRYERDLPVLLDATARSMRTGASLLLAIEESAKLHGNVVRVDFAEMARQVRHGRSMQDVLLQWRDRRDFAGVRLASSSIALAVTTGATHAEVIDRVAMNVRQSEAAKATAKVQATQARTSMWALTLLPVVFTLPIAIIDDATRQFLFDSWLGLAVLGVGISLDGIGAFWMSRLITRATS